MPSMKTSWSLRFASTLLIPRWRQQQANHSHDRGTVRPSIFLREFETSFTQPSQVMGTAKVVCRVSMALVWRMVPRIYTTTTYLERFNHDGGNTYLRGRRQFVSDNQKEQSRM